MNKPLHEEQAIIWDYFKPREVHARNMMVISEEQLAQSDINFKRQIYFEIDYCWENFIIRLWLYRTTFRTLVNLTHIEKEAKAALQKFDQKFTKDDINELKALRDMIEHFDDYAAGKGRGEAKRDRDLDSFRRFDQNQYIRGRFALTREQCREAVLVLIEDAERLSTEFIKWYNLKKIQPDTC